MPSSPDTKKWKKKKGGQGNKANPDAVKMSKKVKDAKGICFHFNQEGHWKRNCPKYLVEKKAKQGYPKGTRGGYFYDSKDNKGYFYDSKDNKGYFYDSKDNKAKQQRNPRKNFRNHPDQNSRHCHLCRRHRGHHHRKTIPPDSDVADLSNGPTPPPSAQLSGQEPIHAPPLSGASVHASPPVNLTAYPIRFYASSPVNHLTLLVICRRTRRPSPPDSNLQNCQICTAMQICPSTLYSNLSTIGMRLTNSITDCGLKWASHRHPPVMDSHMFMVSGLIIPIRELFLKIIHPWHRSIYRSLQETTTYQGSVLETPRRPLRGNKRSSKEQQNLGRTDVRETASTFQPIGPTASQTNSPTLSVIAQSCMSQSFGLISVDGTNPWILDSGATDHLTGFSEHFVTYTPSASNEKIRIANGSLASVAGKGQIVLFDGFSLQKVLHVPKLSYNLLSISKIIRELHCKATFLPESVCFQDLNSGRTIGTARHSRGLYILNDDTSGSSIFTTSLLSSYFSTSEHDFMLWHFRQNNIVFLFPHNHINPHNRLPLSIMTFGVPPRSPPHLGKGAAHLINRMPSRILHPQTPLECLKESYPSTRLVSEGESVSEESNSTFEFIEPTPSTVSDIDPHRIILPTNQVPWKTYYRRNLRKEVGSPTNQPSALVQDFEPPRDQGMKNSTEPCTNNTMSENDRSDADFLENMDEKNHGDETEVRIETSNDEAEQGHTRKHDEYDPSLDLPITLRKGTRSCTKHSISNYVSYENLSPQFRAFTASLHFTTIPKNIYIALEFPEWKNAVMEEMKALEKNNTWEICALPKGHKPVGCKWVFTLKYKVDGTLDRHKASAVSQFMQAPYEEHMEAVKRILRYLKTTLDKGLMFRKTNKKTIEAYTDSDWAGSIVDRKSTSSYCTFVWGNLVTWRSNKQNVVSRSSVEAEYRAMSLGICEEILLQKVLSDLHQECETPLKLFCDNKAAISIVNNPVQHRTKHVEIDRHFIKERLDSGSICIPYIPSSQQVADVLTKGLLRPNFDFCVSKLGLIDIYAPT
ncbi:putative mitochondrial protein [Cucumis melo var. makuwa]|uniref:Mitochondrial protein n=1 Tax=Cucumis melo var. makuwa TaxID=1194695 RepID=A0A5A7V670_CUCMM|nr:putative mitochondrial protein [Cucumis melo var. makuwa]TYK27445.1 putative mitochondrial protein [Cucumis melo var. makuwa]